MGGFSFNVSAFEKMSRDIQKAGENIRKKEITAVKLGGNAYKNDVQPLLQYKTGTLRRSVHVEPSIDGISPVSLVGTNVIYARQRENGGFIKAKNAKFLHWVDDEGNDHFAKQVYQNPHPVWRPVFDANKEKYGQLMIDYLNGVSK
jgi:hypothetical protein